MNPRKYPTYLLYIFIALAETINGANGVLTLLVYKTVYKQVSYRSERGDNSLQVNTSHVFQGRMIYLGY